LGENVRNARVLSLMVEEHRVAETNCVARRKRIVREETTLQRGNHIVENNRIVESKPRCREDALLGENVRIARMLTLMVDGHRVALEENLIVEENRVTDRKPHYGEENVLQRRTSL